jgi:hypothetical protein
MRFVRWLGCCLVLASLTGCGGDRVVVTGTVTLDGNPLPDALVTFRPEGGTGELGGSGRTGPDGKYTLTAARGGQGILPGEYKVVINRPLRRDGSPPAPDEKPIESDARETLPPNYSDLGATTLTAKVAREAAVHDFALTAPKKK